MIIQNRRRAVDQWPLPPQPIALKLFRRDETQWRDMGIPDPAQPCRA